MPRGICEEGAVPSSKESTDGVASQDNQAAIVDQHEPHLHAASAYPRASQPMQLPLHHVRHLESRGR
jgi:hypothetical protein